MMEPETIKIRRMTRSDIDGILNLDRKVSKGHGNISYRDLAASDPGGALDLSFVAEADGKVVSFIMAQLAYVMIPLYEVCIIHGIATDPDYQGHNIGRKLVNELLDHCHAEGINTVRALIGQRNQALRVFFERLGFSRSNIANYDKTFEN